MSVRTITCDRQGDLIRAAVWKGKELYDLYIDHIAQPDMTGAIVRGKVTRVTEGQVKAWINAGLNEKLYIENVAGLKSGDQIIVQIQTTQEQGKAWPCKRINVKGCNAEGELGLIEPPPLPWQRALQVLPKLTKASLEFADGEDLKVFKSMNLNDHKAILQKAEHVHPDLDEQLDALLDPVIPLKQKGYLVIQQTEALVAVDVNGEMAKNPTDLNMRAMHEAVRQIKLRNLSGIIMIDCLSMYNRADKAKIQTVFNNASENAGARAKALGMTKLGLLEVSRMRRGPSLDAVLNEEL